MSFGEQEMPQMKKKSSKKNMPSFLSKTYSMIMDPANEDVISFNDSGNAFVVKNESKLSQEILPLHFKHQHFSSFIRQLNMYGFKKIRNVNNQNEFRHQYFKKNREQLLTNIARRNGTIKKAKMELEKKLHQRQTVLELDNCYLELKQDIISINNELNFIVQQFGQFQNTQQTLIESSRAQLIELSNIKNRNQVCNDLLCTMFGKLLENQHLHKQNPFQQYQGAQTTKSGSGNSENNEQNVGSSKDDTNQSNGSNGSNQIYEEKHKLDQ